MFPPIISIFALSSSLQHFRRSKLDMARRRLDRVLAANPEVFDFIFAYDAVVMIQEGRHDEASNRFRECLAKLPAQMNADEHYISLFCQFYLSAYEVREDLEALKAAASDLEPRKTLRRFLVFPPDAAIDKFVATTRRDGTQT